MSESLLKFTCENDEKVKNGKQNLALDNPWHVLVVDDDIAMHEITRLVLANFHFDSRPLKLTYAFSAKEARTLLEKPNEFSVLLLDVVMESDHAGLDLVSYIREEIKNQFLRIILRTGQPGQAPELSVIVDYDINDYRTKTELTSEKMHSCITAALRSFRDIKTIQDLAVARERLQKQISKRNEELENINTQLKHEIEERFAVEELLTATNNKLESIINNSTALISLKDMSGRYDLVNTMFLNSLAVKTNSVIGKTDHDIFSNETAESVCLNDAEVFRTGKSIQCEEILPTKNGEHFYLSIKFPLYSSEGEIYRICSICTDITERKDAQNEIIHLAQYDSLTGIPNRSLFLDRLTQSLLKEQNEKCHLAVMFIDLDRFKLINDTLGHDIGDQLLIKVAERLANIVDDGDIICRLGGDEFAILLTEVNSKSDVVGVAEQVIRSLSESYIISQRELIVTPSIGISQSPYDGNDIQTLLKKADVAMYKAKNSGRNTYRFYLKADDSKANKLLSLEVDLRKMLAEDSSQLFLMYQPKVDVCSGKYTSVEALVRWQHPKLGVIAPAQFIPLLEETGLILDVGEWVLREACLFATRTAKAGIETKVAVNLSTRQLKQKGIVATISKVLKETYCKPQWLELEMTESALVEDIEYTKILLDDISAMGVTLALDDFGTGYSSLNYLKALPFNTLKIDRSFISDAPNNEQDKAIVTTIAQLAENLHMSVVAEGVETVEQFNLIKKVLGKSYANHIQGYLFSRPVKECDLFNSSKDIFKMWQKL